MAKELKDFRQGDTKVIKIDYGTGVDITGYKFWFSLRTNFEDSSPAAQVVTTAGDHPLDDVVNGLAYIQMEADVSILIPIGKYFWDIQSASGSTPPIVTTLLPTIKNVKDKISIVQHATKDYL